jgi:hypothetical protein
MSNFTVLQILTSGAASDDAATRAGLSFKEEPHTIQDFKAAATSLALNLLEIDENAGTSTTLISASTEPSISTSSLTAGTAGHAEAVTVTVPASSAIAQGDYLILHNKEGFSYAIWFDKNAAGTVPAGALFSACTYKIKCSVITGGANTANAAIVKAACEASIYWDGFSTITDNGDGTLSVVCSALGTVTSPARHNAAENGNGSFAYTVATAGAGDYSKQLAATGGLAPYTYSLDSTSAALPSGYTLSSDGLLSGITTSTGSSALVFLVTDALGQTKTKALTLTVS